MTMNMQESVKQYAFLVPQDHASWKKSNFFLILFKITLYFDYDMHLIFFASIRNF